MQNNRTQSDKAWNKKIKQCLFYQKCLDITLSIDILKLLQECMQIQIYILDSFCTLDSLILSKKIPSLMGFAYPHKVRVSLLL